MSWSVTTQDARAEGMSELIDAMELGEYVTDARDEAQAQLSAGKAAAKLLVAAEAIGKPANSLYRVGINGHSNPGHGPRDGYAHEMVSVVVYEVAQMPDAKDSGPSDSELASTDTTEEA